MSFLRVTAVLAIALWLSLPVFCAEGENTLVKNGVSDWYIVISKYSILSERHAASELQHFLQEISGAELPILEYEEPGATRPLHAHEIILGNNDRARKLCEDLKVKVDFDKFGKEGFVIRTVGPHLLIAGGRPRGTLYGVYTFLEDYLGCRWFDSTVSVIPKQKTITFGEINVTQIPALMLRDIDWGNFRYDPDLAARNKVNNPESALSDTHGGKFGWANPGGHTVFFLLPPDKYFKDHPEYYALVKGERKTTQPCFTNPDVIRIMTERMKQWIREQPNCDIYDCSMMDNGSFCQCPNCKALEEQEGGPIGPELNCVNQIAAEVAKDFPGKYVSTFAYADTEKAPKTLKPLPNVVIRLCTFASCSTFDYEQEGFCYADYLAWQKDQPYEQQSYAKNMQRWSSMTNNLFIWDYVGSLNHGLMPHPSLYKYQQNIRFLVKNHMIGFYAQPGYPGPPGELNGLRAYLLAKLVWNPDYDVEKGMNEYLQAYYGKAAAPIRKYIDLVNTSVPEHDTEKPPWDKPFDSSWTHCSPTRWWLKPELVQQYQSLFDEAERLVQKDEATLRRVRVARLGVDYVQIRTLKTTDPARAPIITRFLNTLDVSGIEDIGYAIVPREYTALVRHCSPAMFKAYLDAGGQ